MSIPEYEEPIVTLEDLASAANDGYHDILLLKDTSYYDSFVNTPCCGPYHDVGKGIVNSLLPMPEIGEQAIAQMGTETTRHIIFLDDIINLFLLRRTCATVPMYISPETLFVDHMGMALQKGSPLLRTMNKE